MRWLQLLKNKRLMMGIKLIVKFVYPALAGMIRKSLSDFVIFMVTKNNLLRISGDALL